MGLHRTTPDLHRQQMVGCSCGRGFPSFQAIEPVKLVPSRFFVALRLVFTGSDGVTGTKG